MFRSRIPGTARLRESSNFRPCGLNLYNKLKKLFQLIIRYISLLAFVKYSKQVNGILHNFETVITLAPPDLPFPLLVMASRIL